MREIVFTSRGAFSAGTFCVDPEEGSVDPPPQSAINTASVRRGIEFYGWFSHRRNGRVRNKNCTVECLTSNSTHAEFRLIRGVQQVYRLHFLWLGPTAIYSKWSSGSVCGVWVVARTRGIPSNSDADYPVLILHQSPNRYLRRHLAPDQLVQTSVLGANLGQSGGAIACCMRLSVCVLPQARPLKYGKVWTMITYRGDALCGGER